MKMELIEGSETSAISTVTPGHYPKENILHIEHGESLKSKVTAVFTSLNTAALQCSVPTTNFNLLAPELFF